LIITRLHGWIKPARAALITTVGTNPGDEWIREGILYLLDGLVRLDPWLVNKHDLSTLTGPAGDAILDAELVVQCGTPFYFAVPKKALYRPYWAERTCATAGWIGPIWRDRIAKVHEKIPVLNLAAGSAQLWGSDGAEVARDRAGARFIREAHAMCRLTTVRDATARSILRRLRLDAPLLPCTSIFARDRLGIEPAPPDRTLLNYMPRAGLYLPQKRGQIERWRKTFLAVFDHFRSRGEVRVVCHTEHDLQAAREIVEEKYIVPPLHYVDLLKLYARCERGLFNRVHAGMVVASFGRPAIVVGTDTRLGMTEPMGVAHHAVGDVTAESLIAELETIKPLDAEPVRREAELRYRRLIGEALSI
jgi:hypothetical protein